MGEPTTRLYLKNLAKSVEEKVSQQELTVKLSTWYCCFSKTEIVLILKCILICFSLQDLKYIYGRYVEWSSPIDKDM